MRRFSYKSQADSIDGVLFSDGTAVCRGTVVGMPEWDNTFVLDRRGEAAVRAYFAKGFGELKFLDD